MANMCLCAVILYVGLKGLLLREVHKDMKAKLEEEDFLSVWRKCGLQKGELGR